MSKECKGIKQEKIRKVFLEKLPRKKYGNEERIDWLKSIGYKVRFIYNDIEGWVEIVDLKNKKIYIKYLNKIEEIDITMFSNCQLGKILGKVTNEFKLEIGREIKDITIIDREYRKDKKGQNCKWYKYKCNKCGWTEGWTREDHLVEGIGCACCANQIVVQGINDIVTTAPWMVKYFQNAEDAISYTKCSTTTINPICPDCGKIKDKEIPIYNIYQNRSIGCTCGDGFSYGHKYVHNLLTQLNLDFEDNKKFDWCVFYDYKNKNKIKTGEYDFIIENIKTFIEVDGDFHRKDNNMSGQSKEESKYLDDMKDLLAHENGYKVIRIYYDDDNMEIKKYILKSELINIFDLSLINWNECNEFALKNIVKEVCRLKESNPSMTTNGICEIMKLSRQTIIRYLKKGSKIWDWANYNPKEEMIKSAIKTHKLNCKQIEIFKNEVSLGVFEGCSDLEKQSEKLFGIKLNRDKMSLVCKGKKSQYKGFTFKFI